MAQRTGWWPGNGVRPRPNGVPPGKAGVKPMASPFGPCLGGRNRPGPGRPGYLAIKDLYQKGFGGNWGGILYTRACQSASA